MHNLPSHCCAPTYHGCYPSYHATGCSSVLPVPYPVYVPCYPGGYYPMWGGYAPSSETTVPQELNADTGNPTASAMIGRNWSNSLNDRVHS